MRLYRTRAGWWAGTQEEARRMARTDGSAGMWAQVDVPTDKPALLAWLNNAQAQCEAADAQLHPQGDAFGEMVAERYPRLAKTYGYGTEGATDGQRH